jgi:hypothetical protein
LPCDARCGAPCGQPLVEELLFDGVTGSRVEDRGLVGKYAGEDNYPVEHERADQLT